MTRRIHTAAEFRAARQQLGFTQGGLAEAIYCSRRGVQQWETGERPVNGPAARAVELLLDRAATPAPPVPGDDP